MATYTYTVPRQFTLGENGDGPTTPEKESTTPAWIRTEEPIELHNHTQDLLQDWKPMWVGIVYFLMEMTTMICLTSVQATAYIFFPVTGSATNVIVRSCLIAAAVFTIALVWGPRTGAHLNPMASIGTLILYLAFDESTDKSKRRVPMEILKVVMFIVAQLIGAFIGISLVPLWAGGGMTTDDCTTTFIPICTALPVTGPTPLGPVTVAQARWMECIAAFFISVAFTTARTFYADRKQIREIRRKRTKIDYHSLAFSSAVSGMYAAMHSAFGSFSGGSFNLFYWVVLAMYVNNASGAGIYVWPLLLGNVTVTILEALYYVMVRVTRSARVSEDVQKMV